MNFKNGGFPCLKYLSINNNENNKNTNINEINKERGYVKKIDINILVNNPSKNIITINNKEDDLEIV